MCDSDEKSLPTASIVTGVITEDCFLFPWGYGMIGPLRRPEAAGGKESDHESLWFAGTGEIAFSSWGYANNEVSQVNIESVNESIAYGIAKPDLEELFNSSIELSNFGRKIFEQEILFIDSYTLAYGTPSAKERYLTLMEENPELLQYVPLKHLASYLYITPQSLSRIRAGLKRRK